MSVQGCIGTLIYFIDAALEVGDRILRRYPYRGNRQVLLILTDGLSNDPPRTLSKAREFHEEGYEIFTLGVSEYIDTSELRAIASSTNNVVHAETFEHLAYVRRLLHHKLCLLPDPAPPATVSPDKCDDDIRLDLTFLIDSSGSINDKGDENYDLLKAFVIELISLLDTGPVDNQVEPYPCFWNRKIISLNVPKKYGTFMLKYYSRVLVLEYDHVIHTNSNIVL